MIGNFLQEKLNELVIINQFVIRTSNLLKEPLNIALEPFNLQNRNLERVKFVGLKLVKEVAGTLAFLLDHLFELMFDLLVG